MDFLYLCSNLSLFPFSVNLTTSVSIGWDYFQVLALFADADIRWPQILKDLFRMLSFFNIDVDVVAVSAGQQEFIALSVESRAHLG